MERFHSSDAEGQRLDFERDRDRVLYTEAFRRLVGVSQVAYTGETELYHDRLSHSLKVAQVGRRIAEYLEEGGACVVNEDVVETAALAHDIGHPPFGHPAEDELDNLIKDKGVSEGFEGNAQSFRVVTHVAVHPETDGRVLEDNDESQEAGDSDAEGEASDDQSEREENQETNPRGLNLTRASLNAMIKYPWKRSAETGEDNKWGEDESKKFGRYGTERELFEWVREDFEGKRRSAEAEIMDWADDLVYAVHDVEDFYRAGVIPLEQILQKNSSERDEFIRKYLDENEDDGNAFSSPEEVEKLLDRIDELGGISQSFDGSRNARVKVKDVSSELIERYAGESGPDIELQNPTTGSERYLKVDPQLRKEVSVLKFMLVHYVLENPAVKAQRRGQRKVVEQLFEIFYNATKQGSKEDIEIIHPPFREEAEKVREDSNEEERVRLVADIITSMTEQQAINVHKRLTGDAPGSLQEHLVR
jgi:dGTPase